MKADVVQLPEGEIKQKLVAEIRERIAKQELEEVSMARFLEVFGKHLTAGEFVCPSCGHTLLFGGVDRKEPYICCIACLKGVFARGDLQAVARVSEN